MKEIFEIIKICIEKIKDEILLFSVVATLLSVSFPDEKLTIFIVYLIGVVLYSFLKGLSVYKKQSNNKFLENFEKYLENKDDWEKRIINSSPVYFYNEDNNYKIEEDEDFHKEWTARESWMEGFPDPLVFESRIYLKHGESKIGEFGFLSCDGGRYLIPIPDKKCEEKDEDDRCVKFQYSWDKNSIEYKLGNIIGSFYNQENIDDVAHFCRITLKN